MFRARMLAWLGVALAGCIQAGAGPALRPVEPVAQSRAVERDVQLDGSLRAYVERALASNPALAAAFGRWRAARRRIRAQQPWPRPQLRYAALPLPVQTRVGPQRQRLGITVPLPSPGVRQASADSQAALANVTARRHAAALLEVQRVVAVNYWQLWASERRAEVLVEQATLWESLAEMAEARIATGGASVAELQQIQLERARLEDSQAAEEERQIRRRAELRRVLGEPESTLPITSELPQVPALRVDDARLQEWASLRPDVVLHEELAVAQEHRARAAAAGRFPGLALAVDWLETGTTDAPMVADNGRDALMVGVSLRLPVDATTFRARQDAALAEAEAHRAEQLARAHQARAEVLVSRSNLRDSRRREAHYAQTLLPQAQGLLESVLGQYQTGQAAIGDVVEAARTLLQLNLALYEARGAQAIAWANLEAAVGRTLPVEEELDAPGGAL